MVCLYYIPIDHENTVYNTGSLNIWPGISKMTHPLLCKCNKVLIFKYILYSFVFLFVYIVHERMN